MALAKGSKASLKHIKKDMKEESSIIKAAKEMKSEDKKFIKSAKKKRK